MRITPLGGTASVKAQVDCAEGSYIVRRTPSDTVAAHLEYDAALRQYLAERGFPAPKPLATPTGGALFKHEGQLFEMSQCLPGRVIVTPSKAQLHEAGRILARLHKIGKGFEHAGKDGCAREDHISVLRPILQHLFQLAAGRPEVKPALRKLERLLEQVAAILEQEYDALEQTVIHGDFHAGNLLFQGNKITAVLDFDYAGRGALLRDIGDGIIFLTGRRPAPPDPNDIRLLTQSWRFDAKRTTAFLSGYAAIRPLPVRQDAIATLMLSRWIQCRLRGSRKVPDADKLAFVFEGFWEPVAELRCKRNQDFLSL